MIKFVVRFVAIPALALVAMAQTGGTGTGTPFQLQTFDLERTQTLTNMFATSTANIPADVLASIQGGVLEVRERLIFNPQQNTLTSTWFTAAPGTPSPTPVNSLDGRATLGTWTMNIDRVYQTDTPSPAIMVVGKISSASKDGPFGSLVGAPAAVSIGYTAGTTVQVSNVVVLVAGTATVFSSTAKGTVNVPPVAPQGSLGNADIQITVAPREFITSSKLMQISAAVTDPSGTALTYQWKVMNNRAVALERANTANVDVTFNQGKGDYTFEITVTNANGQTASALVTITYYGM